jgi:hypothetical protein
MKSLELNDGMLEDIAISKISGAIDVHYFVRKRKHTKEQN